MVKDVTNAIRGVVSNNNKPVEKCIAGIKNPIKKQDISNRVIPQTVKDTSKFNVTLREQAIYKPEALKLKQQQEAIMKRIREFVQKHPEYRKVDYMEGNVHIIYEGPSKCITDKGAFIDKAFNYKIKTPQPQPVGIKIIK